MSARRRVDLLHLKSPLPAALALLLIALLPSLPLHGEVWSDLEEPEYSGSEAEGHYPFNLGYLAYYESWTNGQGKSLKSVNVFHLWKFTYYPKYTSVRFFPLYYSQHSTIDSRRRRLIFPLYYDQVSRDGKGSMSFLLPIYYHEYQNERNSTLLFLLYGSHVDSGDVTRWVGPVYWGKDEEKDTARAGLFPLIQYSSKGSQKELALHPLLGNFEWGSRRTEHLFPSLPFLYYYWNDHLRNESLFYLFPFYHSTEENVSSRFHVLPIYYSGENRSGEEVNDYALLLPLFYLSSTESKSARDRKALFPLIPLVFYYSRGHNQYRSYDTLWVPGYFSYNDQYADADVYSRGRFIPILYYSSEDKNRSGLKNSYTNIALLFNRSTASDPESGAASSSYSVLPFFYSGEGKDRAGSTYDSIWFTGYYSWNNKNAANETASSGSMFPLLYYSSQSTDRTGIQRSYANALLLFNRSTASDPESGAASSSYSVLPFFYSGEGKDRAGSTYDSIWFTGYYSWNNKNAANETASSGSMFPLLYYSSSSTDKNGKESSYSNIALFWNLSSSSERESGHHGTRQHFLPLYYYSEQDADDGYTERLWALPFYQWDLNPETDRRSAGSFLLPLYYHSEKKDSSFWMLSPLYWSTENPETSEVYRISPIYYGHRWREGDAQRFTNWALLLFNWNHEESEGSTFFPFYYRIKDEEKEWELFAVGAVTTADAMLRIRGDSIYLDTDTYLGYGLVGWSSRLPVYDSGAFQRWMRKAEQKPETSAVGESTESVDQIDTAPRVHNDHMASFDRENTSSYSKFQMLFGWVTKIQADTRHHFRFLPLAWVSWDDANKNEYLKYYPFLGLDYSTPEERYTALFPLFLPVYGRHSKGESYTVSYGGPFYIRSYDEEKDEHDLYAPWPFFNRYSDPTKSGTRLIPLFAYRRWKDEEGQHSRWITPLSYNRTTENGDSTSHLTISPVYLSSTQFEHEDDPQRKSGRGWSFFLPAITKTFDRRGSSWNALFLAGGSGTYDDSESFHYFFPIYSYSRDRKERSFRYIWPLGRIYREGLSEDGSAADSGSYFFPLYAQRSWDANDGQHSRSFSLLHYHHSSDRERATFLLPLLYYSDADTAGSSWNFALLTGGSERTNGDRGFYLFPLYSYSRDVNRIVTDQSFLWPLGRVYSYGTGSSADRGWFFCPLFAQRSWTAHDGQHNRSFSLLHYRHVSDRESSTFVLPLLFYRESTATSSAWNFALLSGGSSDRDDSSSIFLFPVYSYTRNERKKETDHTVLWFFGRAYTYGEAQKEDSGFYLFPVFAQREYSDREGRHNRSFSLLHYWRRSSHDEGKRSSYFLSPLYAYESDESGSSSWRLALLFSGSSSADGRESDISFFPLFSNSRTQTVAKTETSSYFLFPLWKSYTSETKQRSETDRFVLWPFFRYNKESASGLSTTRLRFYPLLYYTKEEGACEACYSTYTTLFPLYFRGREKTTAGIESTDLVLGFYRSITAQTEYHNFFYLYEYESEPAYSKLNLLLGMYHQESSQRKNQDIFRMEMLYGILVDADWYGSTSGYAGGYDTRWLLYYQRNNAPGERDAFTSALFPLWRYHSNREESSFLFVPTLSYHTRTGDSAFDCDIVCLSWGRIKERDSHTFWLLGGLLYLKQGRTERGWLNDESDWNLLGRYPRKGETDYSRFSLLGGLYGRSRIESEGYKRDLYLWGVLYGRESDRTEGFDKHSFLLWGALYGSESRANGYRRQSVLWGLLFEDLEDPDKAYKSWSILQGIIYSNVDNSRTNINYRRILGLQILKGPG